jgi:hypothetical protein
MKIKGWDKLRYKFVTMGGAMLAIDTTWSDDNQYDGTTSYYLTICDADNVGETLISVKLKEGVMDEFYLTANLEQPQITPNINRVFRKNDMENVDVFLRIVCEELMRNAMVNSFITLLAEVQMKRNNTNTFSSHSFGVNKW